MPYSPSRHTMIFGSAFVKDFSEHVILTIGKDTWSREQLLKMGVIQTRACAILNSIARQLKVSSLADLYKSSSPYTFADFPAGVTTLYVLFAAFYDRDLDAGAWYKAGKDAAIVSFLSLKARELDARANERKDQARRDRKSRRTRHERAVAPYVTGPNHAVR